MSVKYVDGEIEAMADPRWGSSSTGMKTSGNLTRDKRIMDVAGTSVGE